jgi:hypothetical protein
VDTTNLIRPWVAMVKAWCLWTGATMVGFCVGWGLGRTIGIITGGHLQAVVQANRMVRVGSFGDPHAGAVAFLVTFVLVAWLVQWPALVGLVSSRPQLVWTGRWLVMGLAALLLAFAGLLSLSETDVFGNLFLLALTQILIVLVYWRHVRHHLAELGRLRRPATVVRVGWWAMAVVAGVAFATTRGSQHWLTPDECLTCGYWTMAWIGVQTGGLTGLVLIPLLRRAT